MLGANFGLLLCFVMIILQRKTSKDIVSLREEDDIKLLTLKVYQTKGVNKLDEADFEMLLDIENDAPIMHSLSDGEISEMALNTGNYKNSSDRDAIVNMGEICLEKMG